MVHRTLRARGHTARGRWAVGCGRRAARRGVDMFAAVAAACGRSSIVTACARPKAKAGTLGTIPIRKAGDILVLPDPGKTGSVLAERWGRPVAGRTLIRPPRNGGRIT
jgi:hypothetical protein